MVRWSALALAVALNAFAAEPRHVFPYPTPAWLAAQLVPSFAVGFSAEAISTELRWQVTPVLYSWGAHPKATKWRAFVVEPRLRHGGSVELFAAPMVRLGPLAEFNMRPGLRATFPVLEFGEAMSVSVGLQYQRVDGRDGLGVELGASWLLGIIGLQVMAIVEPAGRPQTFLAVTLRYF